MRPAHLLLQTLRLTPEQTGRDLRTAWSRVSPRGFRSLIDYEGCALWLARRLKDLDALESLDAPLAIHVLLKARHMIRRNLRAAAERETVVGHLNELGVPHVLLKGAARQLLAAGYPYAAARVVGDIDVLVREADALRVWARLRGAGYRPAPDRQRYRGHYHLPPLDTDRGIPVDVHVSTSRGLEPREAWRRQTHEAARVPCAGGVTCVPNPTELLWHAVTHAPLRWPDAFRLRFLQDAAVIWAAAPDIDWDVIGARLRSGELEFPDRARTWLAAAGWLSGRAQSNRALAPHPNVDLAKMLDWRLAVFRVLGREEIGRSAVWARAPRSRVCRLLVGEGTRSAVGLSLGPGSYRTDARRGARRWAAVVARVCYVAWDMGRSVIGRRPFGGVRPPSAALGGTREPSVGVGW